MSKIAIVSDIHSNLHALRAVMKSIDSQDIPMIICAGDIIGYGAYPNACLQVARLRFKAAVKGNHEDLVARETASGVHALAGRVALWTTGITPENMKYLRNLPMGVKFNYGGKRFALFHGSPTSVHEYVMRFARMEDYMPKGCDILVLGHTHMPNVQKVSGGRLFVNPGSVGQPRDDEWKASYAVLETSTMKVDFKRVPYDVQAAADAITKAGLPPALGQRLFAGV